MIIYAAPLFDIRDEKLRLNGDELNALWRGTFVSLYYKIRRR